MSDIGYKETQQAIEDWQELRSKVAAEHTGLSTEELCVVLQGHNWQPDDKMCDVNYKSILAVVRDGVILPNSIEMYDKEGQMVGNLTINPNTMNVVITTLNCRPQYQAAVDYLCKHPEHIPSEGVGEIAFDCGFSVQIHTNNSLPILLGADIDNERLLARKSSALGDLHQFDKGTYLEDKRQGVLCFIESTLYSHPEIKICETWEKYTPASVNLQDIGSGGGLDDNHELLETTLRNNCLDAICEESFTWFYHYDTKEYDVDELQKEMIQDGLEVSEEHIEAFRDWLGENDTSDPVSDSLRHTGPVDMFYSLGLEVDGWSEPGFLCPSIRGSSPAQEAYKIRRVLGIKKGTVGAERVDDLVRHATYGGELRIYFSVDLGDILSDDRDKDFKQVHFKGDCTVAVYHSNGSGNFENVMIDKTFSFTRDNLFTSKSDKYDIANCFGMCSDWLKDSAAPIFSTEPLKSKSKLKKSANSARIAQEAEYNRVFKAGGCSTGDMDHNRHRGVYYDNNVPCGNHCPHCHTFWVD